MKTIGLASLTAFFVAIAGGWVINIISLAGMDWSQAITIEGVLRIVGVIVVPLGGIMGLFA
jgi:hypothetical protein